MKRSGWLLLLLCLTRSPARSQGPDTFFAVHCEPTHTSYYPFLVKMVALADSFGAFLTLEFNPQWADTVLANPPLLNQVRQWQKNGHEIAAHHHSVDYGPGGWDGYTNRPPAEYPVAVKYRGSMQDYFTLLSLMAGDSLLLTGGITDWEMDWPVGLPYRTEGIYISQAVSRPEALSFNGQDVTSLQYGLLNSRQKADSAKAAYNGAGPKDVLGIVQHEKDFAEDPVNLRAWLQFLKVKGGTVKTVRQILRERAAGTAVRDRGTASIPAPSEDVRLFPAYPNPFNPSTAVPFSITLPSRIRIVAFDAQGRLVQTLADRTFVAGEHAVRFDGAELPGGVYWIVLNTQGSVKTRKIVLIR